MIDSYKEYTEVLLKNLLDLKKDDILFVSIDSYNRKMIDYITYMAYEMEVSELYIETNQVYSSSYDNYKNKNAKMLFFSNSKINLEYSECAYSAVLPDKELLDINSTTNKEFFELIFSKTNSIYENAFIKNNIEKSEYKRLSNKLNNLKINELYLSSLYENELYLKKPHFKTNSDRDVIKSGLEVYSDNVYGTIYASKQSLLGNERIEDLIIMLKNNKICDFDCSNNKKLIEELIKDAKFNKLFINSCLDSSYDIYKTTNNFILDKYSCPYISIKNNKQELIMPIGSKCNKIKIYTNKYKTIYQKEKFIK